MQRLIRDQSRDLRAAGVGGFQAWLDQLLGRWERDPVFRQRAAVRNLRRAHPGLRPLERAYRAAEAADAATPTGSRLREVGRAADNAQKAVAGLAAALAVAAGDNHPRLAAKLDHYRQRLRELNEERADLERGSPERRALDEVDTALRQTRAAAGLDREEARLAELLAAGGRRAGRTGDVFEDVAATVVGRELLPELAGGGDVRLLRRVRLGAGAEFDALVVQVPGAGGAAEVLAAAEAKRDINGLAHGFVRRQADLAWLTGEAGRYDPAACRTRAFPAGHFDRAVEIPGESGAVRLGPGSFARFRRDARAGYYLDGLYLLTRPGPLWGLSPPALARVAAWAASDEDFDPADSDYLATLHRRCLGLAGPMEAADVLRLYATDEARGRQVLLVSETRSDNRGG